MRTQRKEYNMSLTATFRGRWRDGSDGRLTVVKKHFNAALDVVDAIQKERATLANDKFLSDLGKSQKLVAFAKSKATEVAKAIRSVEIGRAKMAEARAALIPSVKDKTDVAGALLRREERDRLSKLEPKDISPS